MTDHSLAPEEIQRLFNLSENEYQQQAPEWLRRVQPIQGESDNNIQELLRQLQTFTKTNRRLEQVLINSGVTIPSDIPYAEAKEMIDDIQARLLTCSDANEFQRLAVKLDMYTTALMATDEYQQEMMQKELEWEQENKDDNMEALYAVRRHIPVNVHICSEATLSDELGLPKELARKLIRTNILKLLRKCPRDIERMHPSMLEGLTTTGLTLTERRALYVHMKPLETVWGKAKDPMTERKRLWYNMLKSKFQESLGEWKRHVEQYGRPSAIHTCSAIGNQCPFKADCTMDYYATNGYGFPEGDVFEQMEQAASANKQLAPSSPSSVIRAGAPSFISKLKNTKISCEPAAISKGGVNKELLLSKLIYQGATLSEKKQSSAARKSPDDATTQSHQQSLDDLLGNKPDLLPVAPHKGGLLAGITTIQLKKINGPNEKASLLKEVVSGTPPTKQPAAPSPPVSESVQMTFSAVCHENRTVVTPVVALDEAGERLLALQQHYQKIGKPEQIEEANAICQCMESTMDRLESDLEELIYWQLLDSDDMLSDAEKDKQIEAFRTTLNHLETTVSKLDKRVSSSIGDDRSLDEIELAEDFHKMITSTVVFLLTRGKDLKRKDKSIRDLAVNINSKMQGIHSNNEMALNKLGSEASATRQVRTVDQITNKKKTHLTLQDRSAIRATGLVRHYGKGMTTDAAILCDNLDTAMDRLDSYFDDWVDQMIICDDAVTSEVEKRKLLSYYSAALELLKIPVDELVTRTKTGSLSKIECELAEDLHKLSICVFNFVVQRMKKLEVKDKTIKNLLREMNESIKIVHEKNLETLNNLNAEAQPTRKVQSVKQIIESKMKEKEKKTQQVAKKLIERVQQEVVEVPVSPVTPVHEEFAPASPALAPAPDLPVLLLSPQKELIVSQVVGREHLKWQLIKQVEDADRMKRKLEKTITCNGLTVPDETIGYKEAEAKMVEISKRMQEIGHTHPEYFTLEQHMEKFQAALLASDEYRREIKRREKEWEEIVAPECMDALFKLRRHMPVNIRNVSEAELCSNPTPNGRTLPSAIAKKLKRTNVLQLIRLSPQYIEHVHFANLESMSFSGLTMTENRALYEHIKELGPKWEKGRTDKSIERKYMWYVLIRDKLKRSRERNDDMKETISYDDDYGFPTGAVYEVLEVTKEDMEKYRRSDDDY